MTKRNLFAELTEGFDALAVPFRSDVGDKRL